VNLSEAIFALQALQMKYGNLEVLGLDSNKDDAPIELFTTDFVFCEDLDGKFVGIRVDADAPTFAKSAGIL